MASVQLHPRAKCCWCHRPLVFILAAFWVCIAPACAAKQFAYATAVEATKGPQKGQVGYLYVPTPVQADWHAASYDRTINRLLVGGEAGPGKSRWLRESLYRFAKQVPGFHGLLLRRTFKDLDQSHLRFMPLEVEQRGGRYTSDKIATFGHGKGQPVSIIRAGHMESDQDVTDYLSSEYDVIAPDELVTFEREPMMELFTRARSTNPALKALRGTPGPSGYDGSLVLTSSNPGGRGSLWVKDFFIDRTPAEVEDYDPQEWAFFGARLVDNPYLSEKYERALRNLSPIRRRQLLGGDWTAFEGQFFGEFQPYLTALDATRVPYHVQSRTLRKDLEYFASMDWGYNAPGVVLWWACLLDGHYHLVSEYKFQQESVETVGREIRAKTKDLGIKSLRYIACDPAMKQRTGAGKGESIFETLQRMKLPMRASDNNRFNGWQRCHELLRDDGQGQPWLTVDPACAYFLRTLPAQVQDEKDPDDLDTSGDDHAVDAWRYGAMSRPSPTHVMLPPPPKGTMGALLGDIQREAIGA